MREFLKIFCVLMLFVAGIGGAFAWGDDRPNDLTWILRIGFVALGVVSLGVLLKMYFRRDDVPDYLHDMFGGYFNRGGFCFMVTTHKKHAVCYFDFYFQNQHDSPCTGQIALRPGKAFFGNRADMDVIACYVSCPPAAFGVARVPVSIPAELQGRSQKFDVGASVEYPDGRGKLLRFREGAVIRTNAEFGNTFHNALTVAGAFGGMIVISKPASVTFDLPDRVVDYIPDRMQVEVETIWQLGDPPLADLINRDAR
jgi:hypothetical protein